MSFVAYSEESGRSFTVHHLDAHIKFCTKLESSALKKGHSISYSLLIEQNERNKNDVEIIKIVTKSCKKND